MQTAGTTCCAPPHLHEGRGVEVAAQRMHGHIKASRAELIDCCARLAVYQVLAIRADLQVCERQHQSINIESAACRDAQASGSCAGHLSTLQAGCSHQSQSLHRSALQLETLACDSYTCMLIDTRSGLLQADAPKSSTASVMVHWA